MPAKDVDAYIATAPPEARPMLEQLRALVRSAAPDAEERISYQMPMYKHHGWLVGFAAAKNHVGVYALSSTFLDEFAEAVQPYKAGKGTLRFPLGKPIPVALLKKLVKAKARANEQARATTTRRPRRA
jgi:uncharacterized protein YdhG (YjbR/CyaY superfamily)